MGEEGWCGQFRGDGRLLLGQDSDPGRLNALFLSGVITRKAGCIGRRRQTIIRVGATMSTKIFIPSIF